MNHTPLRVSNRPADLGAGITEQVEIVCDGANGFTEVVAVVKGPLTIARERARMIVDAMNSVYDAKATNTQQGGK